MSCDWTSTACGAIALRDWLLINPWCGHNTCSKITQSLPFLEFDLNFYSFLTSLTKNKVSFLNVIYLFDNKAYLALNIEDLTHSCIESFRKLMTNT